MGEAHPTELRVRVVAEEGHNNRAATYWPLALYLDC